MWLQGEHADKYKFYYKYKLRIIKLSEIEKARFSLYRLNHT